MLRTATLRATHQLLDRPLILDDPIAIGLVPEPSQQELLATLHNDQAALRALFALRSRFAEDRLAQGATRGIRQYVILGAGLDTFAWRQPDYAKEMRIFAVDHATTLAWTRALFQQRGLPKPANLTFVPMDLEDRGLGERLIEFGFDPGSPSFCCALGVTHYLDRASVDALLGFAASLRAESEIVFSFVLHEDDLRGDDMRLAAAGAERVAALGEPWKTRLRPRELVECLKQIGFKSVFHLTPECAQRRYFMGRADGLRAPGFEQIMCAIV